jgi:hypothetical protein
MLSKLRVSVPASDKVRWKVRTEPRMLKTRQEVSCATGRSCCLGATYSNTTFVDLSHQE